MAQNSPDDNTELTADHAMNVVLEAEAEAKQRVEQCKTEAELLLQQARQQAQKIEERADNRITRIHQRCSREITDQVKQLKAAQERKIETSEQQKPDVDTIIAVVEEVAGQLTNPDPGST